MLVQHNKTIKTHRTHNYIGNCIKFISLIYITRINKYDHNAGEKKTIRFRSSCLYNPFINIELQRSICHLIIIVLLLKGENDNFVHMTIVYTRVFVFIQLISNQKIVKKNSAQKLTKFVNCVFYSLFFSFHWTMHLQRQKLDEHFRLLL